MYKTVLDHIHGWSKAMTTYLICRINSEATPLILQNTHGNRHAEELLIEKLNQRDKSLLTTITIYTNNSPCSKKGHDCARELIKFLNENTNVITIFYVTNLYNIRRVSCKNELHYPLVSQTEFKANFTGLKELMKHDRCVVNAFSYAAWSELLNIVPVSEVFKSQLLAGYKTKLDTNDRSREDEDNRIRSDLACIR